MKKILTSLFIVVGLCTAAGVSQAQTGFLNSNTVQNINDNSGALGDVAGYDQSASLAYVVSVAIKGMLGLLGIIFIILIIVAGINWMTAGGDEEKIKKATGIIRNAVIGLIIIVSAYAITYFVFSNLPGGGSGPTYS